MAEESLSKLEEKILKFWKENKIFEKSLSLRKRSSPFRFFEGPPTANAAPGFHHMLARVYKDVICRWKTMAGFYVERKAGWDTHGLPVELQVEKELGLKHKGDIEKFGIAEFNKRAKDMTWRFKRDWERFTERFGYWLDLEHPYITYDSKYMETLWWILKRVWQKGLLEKDYKVVPYCPRCETPLSSHEVAQGYKTVRDPSVYLRLRIKNARPRLDGESRRAELRSPEYLLVWTTTPWTLPANVAVAVNPRVIYTKYKIAGDYYWSATPPPSDGDEVEVEEKRSGKSFIGFRYEPIFRTSKRGGKHANRLFSVVAGDFVSTEEGTGFVHIAPAFGEEDMGVARKEKLPVVVNVTSRGRFAFLKEALRAEPFFKKIIGKFVKDADPIIFEELKERGVLFDGDLHGTEHEYPFCWRCQTPLLYYATDSWFIRMSKIRNRVIANNAKVNWVPSHLKEGRFGEWLRELKDWAFSRGRYWGTPLPIWECEKCANVHVVGSLQELNRLSWQPNTFFTMRHGEADQNLTGIITPWPEPKGKEAHLTERGRKMVEKTAKALSKLGIDVIVASDLVRIRETVAISKKHTKGARVVFDARLRELNCGVFNYRHVREHHRFYGGDPFARFTKRPVGGENLFDAQARYFAVWQELNQKFRGKNILMVGHGDPLWAFEGKVRGFGQEEILKMPYPGFAELRKLPQNDLPYNDDREVDLHRPYVDATLLRCSKCHHKMRRVKEVADVWYDSGAMPFAECHYPFENKEKIDQGSHFPADYIAEAVDQTRGWFYTLLAISTLLGKGPAYLNVVSTGHVLDEKGEKMSKSKGNIVDPWQMFEKYGADALRWYFFTVNAPGEPKRFTERDLAKTHQDLLILYNVLKFWETYSPKKLKTKSLKLKAVLDRWVVAKLATLISGVRNKMDGYEIVEASREIQNFFTEDLSRWYVRRSRLRFQRPKNQKELHDAAAVLADVLLQLARLMASFTPFLSEVIWRAVTSRMANAKNPPSSVHLTDLPKSAKVAGASTLLVQGQASREIAALGLQARAKAGIKVRQPLAELRVLEQRDGVNVSNEWLEVVAEEINVKEVCFRPQLPRDSRWILVEGGKWRVALDSYLTPQLKSEGLIREIIRSIQEGRAELSLNPEDKILVWVWGADGIKKTVERGKNSVIRLTGAKTLSIGKTEKLHFHKEYEVDGQKVEIAIRKLSDRKRKASR